MQRGSLTGCYSLFARRYPPIRSITKQQQLNHRPQKRCSILVASTADGVSVGDQIQSPRARSKPPLKQLLFFALLFMCYPSTVGATNSTFAESEKLKEVKLRLSPAARHSAAVGEKIVFTCLAGQEPYRWEYQIREQSIDDWRVYIRSPTDNCLVGAHVRPINLSVANSFDSRISYTSDGSLIIESAQFDDSGIYRCFSSQTQEFKGGCIELHLLVFEPISYMSHIRIIYGLFAIIIFVASLSTAWQLWNSSAFHRKAMARYRSDEAATKGAISSISHHHHHHDFSPTSALNPVLRFFSRSRSPSANKSNNMSANPDDAARWPVLRRRLSSIDDSANVLMSIAPVNNPMAVACNSVTDEHISIQLNTKDDM